VDPQVMSHLQGNVAHTIAQYETLDHSSLVPVLVRQRAWGRPPAHREQPPYPAPGTLRDRRRNIRRAGVRGRRPW
jgi:hypothetical protein